MIALVAVVTRFLIVPVGAGYFNFSDMAIYFVAFTFGPWIGFLAGGIGARYFLFRKKDIFLRFDLAFTREGSGFYIFTGEAF
jgi:hypothetical protein